MRALNWEQRRSRTREIMLILALFLTKYMILIDLFHVVVRSAGLEPIKQVIVFIDNST